MTTTSKYDKVNTRLVKQERRTSKKFEKINKKVVDKQNNIWYTKRVAAETDNNKEPWKSKIEQYVKPWKFEWKESWLDIFEYEYSETKQTKTTVERFKH